MSTSREAAVAAEIEGALADLPLVDHHVHSTLSKTPTLDEFGALLTESDRPAAAGTSPFDTQVAFAVRRHCAPLLGVAEHAPMADYWSARSALDPVEVDRRLLGAAGVDRWLVDTGFGGDAIVDLDGFAARVPGSGVDEIVRLESLLEAVALGSTAEALEDDFVDALRVAATRAAGLKSVVAYRYGFDFDPTRPSTAEIRAAAGTWLRSIDAADAPRVADPVLLRALLWHGVETGLPLQLHAGFGDPDLDLRRCDPLLLAEWIRLVEPHGSDIMLLHCYPFQRQAGFLAQAFPHVYLDVGLAVNYTGAASPAVLAEALELSPFGKVLYSSDAWGPSELHLLGAVLWRRAMSTVLGHWVAAGEWSLDDAVRVATLVGRTNAERVYGVSRA